MKIAKHRRRRQRALLLAAFVSAAFAIQAAIPRDANAACTITAGGNVDCAADTATTDTINLDGAKSGSADRQQLFTNGAAINAIVQPGVSVGGFGLRLSEGAAAPVTVTNQGLVSTARPVDALHIDGDGGPTSYSGNGGVTNTNPGDVALFVDNVAGNVSIATGAGAIMGSTGIIASTTGVGAVTIATGSGPVSGRAGPGIVAATKDGPVSVTIGSGGVTSEASNKSAIDVKSVNGDISVTASGAVSGNGGAVRSGDQINVVGGVLATSSGVGNITIGGSGTFFGQFGRSIWAQENATALGGILVTGSGDTIEGSTTLGCCSAIRAEIENPADSNNVVVDRTGDVIASSTFTNPASRVSAAIHALTAGAGNLDVIGGATATISNTGLFGIDATAFGRASSGSINVSTGSASTVKATGTGAIVENEAFAIAAAAHSTITATNNGTINSGAASNPVGFTLTGGSGAGATPGGVIAGYDGGPAFGPASGPYTSCGYFGCTTLTPNPNVNGAVSVINNGAINAAGGNGIFAFNFGNGDVSVASIAPIVVTGASSRNGIEAFSAEVGALSVTTAANVSALHGNGVYTDSVGRGATTINVIAGVVEGGTSGVTAHAKDGAMSITNSGTIQNVSGQPGDLAVRTLGSGGTLRNGPDGIITGLVSMTGVKINVFANAGVWNTLGASPFAGSASIANSGVLDALGPTTLLGPATLINSGLVNLTGGAGSPYPTLTTRNYVGAGGVLALNADLGAGEAGRLVIDGGAATGHTVLIVDAVTGSGAPTSGDGVEVIAAIHGATTAPGAFTLGARVAAGAYQYQLYDGGDAGAGGDPDNQNWYLRSSGFRPEVPLDAAIPALASRFGLDMLGTYHDRVGEAGVLDAGEAGVLSAGEAGVLDARDAARAADGPTAGEASRLAGWSRLFGEAGSGGLVGGGPGSDFGLSGFQTGVDLYRRAAPDRSQDAAGLYVGAGAANAAITLPSGGAAGDLSMSGTALGGYWTHRGSSGWYVDALAQGTRFDNVAANSAAGQTLATSGWGLAASLEGGYPLALGRGVTLEPQAQAIFQRISLRGGQDAYGLVNFADADPLYGRIGARLSRLWTFDNGSAIETWGRANLWRAFGPDASATFSTMSGADPASFGTSLGGTWAQFGLGASSRIARHVAVFAAADCDLAVDGPRGHSYQGRIGVEIAW